MPRTLVVGSAHVQRRDGMIALARVDYTKHLIDKASFPFLLSYFLR
jgi:hypothetical protein